MESLKGLLLEKQNAMKKMKSSNNYKKYRNRAELDSLLEDQEVKVVKRLKKQEQQTEEAVILKNEIGDRLTVQDDLDMKQIVYRFRQLGQPICLFGESEMDKRHRLELAKKESITVNHEMGVAHGHDIRNTFLNDDGKDSKKGKSSLLELNENVTKEEDGVMFIYVFFRTMIKKWELDLRNRPDAVKQSMVGQRATKTMKQCKDYIRPLFKLCKSRQVPQDILPKLVDIVSFCKDGEFVRANDAYISLAIGNAAWPIGVTMVGIHERSGREKIHSNKQAHVMNNELQRKYLTSVKRLMSYCQSQSTALPSKRVN